MPLIRCTPVSPFCKLMNGSSSILMGVANEPCVNELVFSYFLSELLGHSCI